MKILCIIPSRIGSNRLPRKPLLPIQGKPMIQWTYENAARAGIFSDVIVATDNDEIANVINNIGGNVMLTSPDFPTGTERVAFVAQQFNDMDVVVNLQGDEPFIKPKMLNQLVAPFLAHEELTMTTLAFELAKEKYHSPNAVKVITDLNKNAIYFSRSPIPYYRSQAKAPVYQHVGLYAFRPDFLQLYKTLPITPLEQIESLEQLRVLEHGYKIRVSISDEKTLEINTPDELAEAQQFVYTP